MKNKKPLIIVASILVLALIGAIGQWATGDTPDTRQAENTTSANKNDKIDRTRAYVIAKQFAENHFGSASYGTADDGFEDMSNGTYLVTGVADMPGRRSRWTIEIKYKGGDWSDRKNWTEKNWHSN